MTSGPSLEEILQLLDWKRKVFDLYRTVRAHSDRSAAWAEWRAARDRLFRDHPQSPLPPAKRASFEGLPYFDYDPAWRAAATVEPATPTRYDVATSGSTTMAFTRVGRCRFSLGGNEHVLELYWLDAYAGGLFLPFRDTTSGGSTYGAGRYLLDTVKGADLGTQNGALVIDFNFAYNPSCAYDPRWVCPLAPPPNHLDVPIEGGEKHRE